MTVSYDPVFEPGKTQIAGSQLTEFMAYCSAHLGNYSQGYAEFEQFCWSEYQTFWRLFLQWARIPVAGDARVVCAGDHCETAVFFPDLCLNYAEVLLAAEPDELAIIACHKDRTADRLTRRDLMARIAGVAMTLQRLDVRPGDHVAAIARNNAEVVIAALACAAIGAVFASCATDMGVQSICLRFEPLTPVVMFANLAATEWDVGEPLPVRVADVLAKLPTVRALIALDGADCDTKVPLVRLDDGAPFGAPWQRFPFNQPLFILFSSGTTGAPKCIIHGAGGTLLEHLKEHRLHCDLRRGDRLFFQTSCAWMMWHWQLSALASGVTLVLYDGPLDNPETLWRLVGEQKVTVFGTNPAYLQFCETANCEPCRFSDVTALRSLLSTGSILYPHQYDWVLKQVKHMPVQSISGGTDIIGCFVLGNPNLPVYRGEAQCRSLGLNVLAYSPVGGVGDLVCANPFPSRPLGFYHDDGSRFHAAYFAAHPDLWTHGDLIEFTASGGAILHGRSDGVMNIRGIRIGPAEIYRLLQGIPAVIEALAVEQQDDHEPGGNRLILLVVLRQPLDTVLTARIRRHLMTHGIAAMGPAQIIQVDALPVTHSGKRSETAARDAVNGRPISNRAALRNPDCLDGIAEATRRVVWRKEPQELVESWLTRMCEEIFGATPAWSDNLLQFGDSLAILNLYLEIGRVIGRPLPWLTMTPTIARLAAMVRNEQVSATGQHVMIRPAGRADERPICRLLHEGFPAIPPDAWINLFTYPWMATPPTYGFVLEAGGRIVGYLGALYADRTIGERTARVCNLTSWYIDPAYRGWGAAMLGSALEFDGSLTYTAFTPAALPKEIFKAMQFTDFVDSSVVLPPLWHADSARHQPSITYDPLKIRPYLSAAEQRIFDDHVNTDCLHVLVDQSAYLVVKRRRYRRRRWLPHIAASKVLYCGMPEIVTKHLEWIKLAIMRRQRTTALVVSARWFATSPRGLRYDSHMLMRSPVFRPEALDMLYSEICLLPV